MLPEICASVLGAGATAEAGLSWKQREFSFIMSFFLLLCLEYDMFVCTDSISSEF